MCGAVKAAFKEGYSVSALRRDMSAALVVSLVALPLAMALAIAVGLPPQHGLYTAIVAGIITPLVGGSALQVSGPTAAFVVIVAPIVSEHGLRGLIIAEIMAGLLLVLMGIAKLGRYIKYIPYPVTTGFTAGIAVVIGTIALNDFFGLGIADLSGSYLHKLYLLILHACDFYWPEALIGIVSLMVMAVSGRWIPQIPSPVVGIFMGTLLALFFQHSGFEIATIGNHFSYLSEGRERLSGIPPYAPALHWFGEEGMFAWPELSELQLLFIPALVIAALAALESLLSATVADSMAGTHHEPNDELVGIGIGNVVSGLAAGIPATGAIARTATNIQSGGKSPISASLHAVFILLYVMFFAAWIAYIPMAALAALLVMVAYRMSHWRQFVRILQIAPKADSAVLLICFTLTVFIDMVAGVTAGMVTACFLLVQRLASLTEASIAHSGQQPVGNRQPLPEGVIVFRITGALFFGSIEKAFERSGFLRDKARAMIIDLDQALFIDMSGMVAMKELILRTMKHNCHVILCGKQEIIGKILQKIPPSERTSVGIASDIDDALEIIRQAKT